MDTYRLNDLKATVGMFGSYPNFTEAISDLVKIDPRLHIDNLDDLIVALTGHDIDEDKARDLCMEELDGEDVDDEDPEAEWGDEMYCRQAGKQVAVMHDAQEWLDGIIADIPNIRKEMLDDCRTMKTYGKAKQYAKQFKVDFEGNYKATAEEQAQSLFNSLIEDVITELNRESDKGEIKHE